MKTSAQTEAERLILVQALALLITAADGAGCFLYCSNVQNDSPLGKRTREAVCDSLIRVGDALDLVTTVSEYESANDGYDCHSDTQERYIREASARLATIVAEFRGKYPSDAPAHTL
jgi:hypothetical protein